MSVSKPAKLTIIQCSGCGAPIGVMDPATGPQIEALKNQIAAIDEKLNRIACESAAGLNDRAGRVSPTLERKLE